MPRSLRGPYKSKTYTCVQCNSHYELRRRPNPDKPLLCPDCKRIKANERAAKAQYWKRPDYKDKNRRWRLKAYYSLSQEDYDKLLELQGGVCAICKTFPDMRWNKLNVDHDHQTGKVRGLLCPKCNRAIGTLGDSTMMIQSAVGYLQRSERLTWDQYFVEFARLAATRSKDPSSQVGAVVIRDKIILSTGYNGFPRGVNDNVKERYERPAKYLWTVHAEENALLNAARIGVRLEDSSLYVSPFAPCAACAKSIVSVGIKDVIVDNRYDNPRFVDEFELAAQIFKAAKVLLREPE